MFYFSYLLYPYFIFLLIVLYRVASIEYNCTLNVKIENFRDGTNMHEVNKFGLSLIGFGPCLIDPPNKNLMILGWSISVDLIMI